jgi:5-methylcytosine-specific restriction enzyme subunit McrC
MSRQRSPLVRSGRRLIRIRHETLVESVPRDLDLDLASARALAAAGRSLAPRRLAEPEEDDSGSADTSLIKCSMNPAGTWRVTVSDAVGLVSVRDLQLVVEPKIPRAHLFYLFGHSDLLPRVDEMHGAAEAGAHLWQLVSEWFVRSVEVLLRRELARDYLPFRATLEAARGQIDALATGTNYYSGQLGLVCDFEEFGSDTPLNRVVKAAALAVTASTELTPTLRRRALAVTVRMEEVGDLGAGDLRVVLDRRTGYYRDALLFARNILSNVRRTIGHGNELVWTFLIRTPELVESGLRNVLHERLGDQWSIEKRSIPLAGADMTVRPDLVIDDGKAIADVKYKLAGARWTRADLYEVVAFAEAAGSARAAIVGFRRPGDPQPPEVGVGETTVRYLGWDANEAVEPELVADDVASAFANWLNADQAIASP